MCAQMVATSSRNTARSAFKLMGNDSLAFYPSASNSVKKTSGDSFAFYPSAGAKRIPISQQASKETITKIQGKMASASLKYSRAELDALFSQSRCQANVKNPNLSFKNTSDSLAYYATKTHHNAPTMQKAKSGSFGYYPSQGAIRNTQKNTKSNNPSSNSTKSESSGDDSNSSVSVFAAGSLAMGMFLQGRRTFARP